MWHVKIPDKYYDIYFPINSYKSNEERLRAITDWQDEIEKNLSGVENAKKAFFSTFTLNESGRSEEEIKIEKLDTRFNLDEKLSTSAAANSEILFSLMVNPSVLGAGMPGGPYAGNAGSGSDIREGLMASMNIAFQNGQVFLKILKQGINAAFQSGRVFEKNTLYLQFFLKCTF